jgi:type IX secretion system PorP/SprF family membrane protein
MYTRIISLFFLCFLAGVANAQDPHFSQFFLAPQFINPSLTATNVKGKWRLSSNYRQQKNNNQTTYRTFTVGGEARLMDKNSVTGPVYGSLFLMSDRSMNGALVSNYVSNGFSYMATLNENNRIGVGFGLLYGQRKVDYSMLNFGEQLTNGGLDASLPTGEIALGQMKPFLTMGTGIVYNFHTDDVDFDAGVSVHNINSPKQTFLNDPNQQLSKKYVVNVNLSYAISDLLLVNMNSVYQQQQKSSLITAGGSLGIDISGDFSREKILFAGLWYRYQDVVYPFVGMKYNNVNVGITYDIPAYAKNMGASSLYSTELSLIIHLPTLSGYSPVPCPWKP